ncbi:MAG: hypothetical protein R3F20_18940 [Planctomycetota bacterium]
MRNTISGTALVLALGVLGACSSTTVNSRLLLPPGGSGSFRSPFGDCDFENEGPGSVRVRAYDATGGELYDEILEEDDDDSVEVDGAARLEVENVSGLEAEVTFSSSSNR